MEKVYSLLAAVLLTVSAFAQAPEKMSYQAIIRNSSGTLVSNAHVGMQLSILKDSIGGTPVYIETQTPMTNENGLVTIEIGAGTVLSGAFASIDWANGPYYLQTDTDPEGGTNYTITGTNQLLSVPYALYAKMAETVRSSSNSFYLGQDTLGGIVFHVYQGPKGEQHGLIVSKTESLEYLARIPLGTNIEARSWDGAYNTNLMTDSPAKDWVTSNFSADWYIPSIDELMTLWNNRFHANRGLNNANATLLKLTDYDNNSIYWSSTDDSGFNNQTFCIDFSNGITAVILKDLRPYYVRAIRAF